MSKELKLEELFEAVRLASPFTYTYLKPIDEFAFVKGKLVLQVRDAEHFRLLENTKTKTLIETKLFQIGFPNTRVSFLLPEAFFPMTKESVFKHFLDWRLRTVGDYTFQAYLNYLHKSGQMLVFDNGIVTDNDQVMLRFYRDESPPAQSMPASLPSPAQAAGAASHASNLASPDGRKTHFSDLPGQPAQSSNGT